jgi:MATE family multidrug resistance protein
VRSELRALLGLSAPLAAAYLAEIAMGITDMLIVGRLGSVELAAVGLGSSVIFELVLVAVGIVSIVGVLAAEAFGSQIREAVSATIRQGLWVALAIAVPATILGRHLTPILALTGQDERVLPVMASYLGAVVWAILPYLWFVVLRNFVAALSRAGSVMVITVVAIAVNAFLTYAMVFGRFGFPNLGVAGAGWATTGTIWLMLAAIVFHTWRSKPFAAYRLYGGILSVDLSIWREIFRLGAPVAGITVLEGGLFVAVSISMGVLGASWLAANEIVLHVLAIGFVLALAVGEAAGIRIAQGLGAGSAEAVRRSAVVAIVLGIAVMVCMASLLWLFPEFIVPIFLDLEDANYDEVLGFAVILAGIAAVFQVFDGLQAIATRALRGMKDTFVPMWIASVGYWLLGMLGGWALCFSLGYGAAGLWWGLALGLTATAILLVWRLLARTRVSPTPV